MDGPKRAGRYLYMLEGSMPSPDDARSRELPIYERGKNDGIGKRPPRSVKNSGGVRCCLLEEVVVVVVVRAISPLPLAHTKEKSRCSGVGPAKE
jgi:hypothetical protein